MIQVGLIGINGYGKVHLELIERWKQQGFLNLKAVTDPCLADQSASRKHFEEKGVLTFAHYRDMLSRIGNELDLCIIPTPIHLHATMAIDCMEAGAHVLLEKPLAATLEDGKAIIDKAKELDRLLMIGFQEITSIPNLQIKQKLVNGEIGKIKSISCYAVWPRPLNYFNRNNWAGKLVVDELPVRDSPLQNALSHFLHLMLFWAGKNTPEVASLAKLEAEAYRAFDIESFDTACIRGITPDGIEILFACTHAGDQKVEPHIQVIGEKGRIDWYREKYALCDLEKDFEIIDLQEDKKRSNDIMFASMINRIKGNTSIICDGEMALPHLALISAIHESVRIHTIPEEFKYSFNIDGAPAVAINGIAPLVRSACDRRMLFSEMGIPWRTAKTDCLLRYPD